jgi:aryl-alcohol dehydrogenase-like predicted oxidoreductase
MVGAIGFGCMSFGGMYGPADDAESHRALALALDAGVDHLDTARIYGAGRSEEVIGAFIKHHPGRFTIATKGGIRTSPAREFDNSPEFLRECIENSLKRLGVEHVELFYIHRRDQRRPIEEVMDTLLRFKQEGKIGGIGFSEISPASLERANAVHPVMAVQSEYSLWTRLPELGMLQACERLGTAFVAFSPLGRGIFGDTPLYPPTFTQGDFRVANPRFLEPNFSANEKAVARFRAFAREKGYTTASLAIAWTLHRGKHIIPIPGTRTAAHLADDLKALEIRLTPADIAEIDAILPPGFAHGNRYSAAQAPGPETYC